MKLNFIILTLLSLECRIHVTADDNVVVKTKTGEIVGKTINVPVRIKNGTKSVSINTFYGIPFAEPPIGELRFKPPVEVKPWDGKRNAFHQQKTCYQLLPQKYWPHLSEDCLYLNIWTPNPRPVKAAVMVWIYGGGFCSGGITIYHFSTLAASQNVIVVAMNYRVSSLGFFYLGNDECPGNMGLWDQQLALKWVRDNIENFGGDRDKVTLFGQSAGSASTGHHLLNPISQNLFQRAILQSGSPYAPWAVDGKETALKKTIAVAKVLGCTDSNLIKCLRKIEPLKLVEMSAKLGGIITMNHVPVFDNKIIFEDRRERLKTMTKKEVMLGITNHDGAFLINILLKSGKAKPQNVFNESLKHFVGNVSDNALKSVKYYYKNHCSKLKVYGEEVASALLATDLFFTCSTNDLAGDLSTAGFPTYLYQFGHRPAASKIPIWIKSDHGAEFKYVVGHAPESEHELSNRMMNYWGCFAKNGDPNCKEKLIDDEKSEKNNKTKATMKIESWPKFTETEKGRIELRLQSSLQAFGAIHEDQCWFWKNDFPILSPGGNIIKM